MFLYWKKLISRLKPLLIIEKNKKINTKLINNYNININNKICIKIKIFSRMGFSHNNYWKEIKNKKKIWILLLKIKNKIKKVLIIILIIILIKIKIVILIIQFREIKVWIVLIIWIIKYLIIQS